MPKKPKSNVPTNVSVAGVPHECIVLRIINRDSQGRPSGTQVMYDGDVVHLKGGEEFMTAWIPAHMEKKGD